MKLEEGRTLFRCDVCQDEFWWPACRIPCQLHMLDPEKLDGNEKEYYRRYDLCPTCAAQVEALLQSKKEGHSGKEEKAAGPDTGSPRG